VCRNFRSALRRVLRLEEYARNLQGFTALDAGVWRGGRWYAMCPENWVLQTHPEKKKRDRVAYRAPPNWKVHGRAAGPIIGTPGCREWKPELWVIALRAAAG